MPIRSKRMQRRVNTVTDFFVKEYSEYLIDVEKSFPKYSSYENHYNAGTTGFAPVYERHLEDIFSILSKMYTISELKQMSFIDLGAGVGHLVNYFNGKFKSVKGIEFNKVLYREGKKIFPSIDLIQGNVKDYVPDADILYTFRISRDSVDTFYNVLKNMKEGQIFIEVADNHGWNSIASMGAALNFKTVLRDFNSTILIK